ncbi:N-6 DNA methylase [Marinilactibacillus psychrotolerans]|uniref:N-6 DNA methylase n=1 Tax=Marinilactibacillus psychrotolerans TaxID=191770 RepID=UPI0018675AD8|nr:N-6 DNA methylase [Marinilactibacillus psychrotolerans]
MDKQLWTIADKLRGSSTQGERIILVTSITLVQYHDEKNLQSLLQSLDFSKEKFKRQVIIAAKELGVEIPGVLEELDFILEKLEMKVLQELLFNTLEYFKTSTSQDLFEAFIKTSEINSGKNGGENSTPDSVNKLALKVLNVSREESFLDPSCGYGNAIVNLLKDNPSQKIVGQEINLLVSEVTTVRTLLFGSTNTSIKTGDVLREPKYTNNGKLERFDTIYTTAPMGMKMRSTEIFKEDTYNRFLYGVPPKSTADWGFISNGISSLTNNGRAVFLTNAGALFRGGAEKKIRQRILDFDLVEAVISLAPGLLSTTTIPTVLLIINKKKSETRKNKVLMINVEEIVSKDKQNFLSDENIQFIYDLYSKNQGVDQVSKIVDLSDIKDGDLLPSRYVFNTEMKVEGLGTLRFNLEKMNQISTVELGKISEIKRGFNLTSKDESENGIYRVIKISDVQGGKIDFEHLSRCNVKKNTKIDNFLVKKGDVIISTRGMNIKIAVISEDVKNVILSQNFNSIHLNEKIDPTWLKMFLESPVGQYQLELNAAGTVVRLLQTEAIKALKIPITSLEKQKEIISIYEKESEKIYNEIGNLQIQLKNEKMKMFNSMGLEETFEILE